MKLLVRLGLAKLFAPIVVIALLTNPVFLFVCIVGLVAVTCSARGKRLLPYLYVFFMAVILQDCTISDGTAVLARHRGGRLSWGKVALPYLVHHCPLVVSPFRAVSDQYSGEVTFHPKLWIIYMYASCTVSTLFMAIAPDVPHCEMLAGLLIPVIDVMGILKDHRSFFLFCWGVYLHKLIEGVRTTAPLVCKLTDARVEN